MKISATQVKKLREATLAPIMDCKTALLETKGDLEKAKELLRKKGLAHAKGLIDKKARNHINNKEEELKKKAIILLKERYEYGLRGIVCTSFDLSPIICFSKGNKYSLHDIDEILRKIGNIPDIKPYEWKYRQSLYKNKPIWVFVINSGAGVTVKHLFEPYYYLLLVDPNSYIGEFPEKLTSEFNLILS